MRHNPILFYLFMASVLASNISACDPYVSTYVNVPELDHEDLPKAQIGESEKSVAVSGAVRDYVAKAKNVLTEFAKDGLANRDLSHLRESIGQLINKVEVKEVDGSLFLILSGSYVGAVELAMKQKSHKNQGDRALAEVYNALGRHVPGPGPRQGQLPRG